MAHRKESGCMEKSCRYGGGRRTPRASGTGGTSESTYRYWIVAIALLVEVVQKSHVGVGVPATVVVRVIEWTLVETVLLLNRARNCLEGLQELPENSAVFNIFDSFRSVLILLGPFLHALVTSNINYYTLHSEG